MTTAKTTLQKSEPLSPNAAARLLAFGRACKAAARAVTLYPATHPSLRAALDHIVAASSAGAGESLALTVIPDDLVLGGRRLERSDLAVTELAMLLHGHAVGELVIQPGTGAEVWRSFLLLIAESIGDVRARGGIARAWEAQHLAGIQVREINYAEVLKDRARGAAADWTSIVSACLQGGGVELDDESLEILLDIIRSPNRLVDLTSMAQGAGLAAGGMSGGFGLGAGGGIGPGQGPGVGAGSDSSVGTGGSASPTSASGVVGDANTGGLASLFGAIAGYVSHAQPERLDEIYSTLAEATGRLSVDALLQLLVNRRSGRVAGSERDVVGEIVSRLSDATVAQIVARSITSGEGASARLADAFQTLVPEGERQDEVLRLAKEHAEASAGGPEFDDIWKRAEQLLKSYSDRRFVGEAYDRELSRAHGRAVEIEQTSDDPPERIQRWLDTIDDTSIRGLDAQLLLDLLEVEANPIRWRELAEVAASRISDLVILGDFGSAQKLADALVRHAQGGGDPARRPAAQDAIGRLLGGSLMRHVAAHFESVSDVDFEHAKKLCYTLGTVVIKPLAEALASEERARPRQRMRDLLLGFGAAGRQSVEQLKQSPNAGVRRTAIYLLREFGGDEALPELESLLDDTEPHVQREAIRAILMIGIDAGYAVLTRALTSGSARSRATITAVLAGLRDERAAALFCYILRHSSHRGRTKEAYRFAVEALGRVGGHDAIAALKGSLGRGDWWLPFATAAHRTAVAAALARINTNEAWQVLEEAASDANRGVRTAAKAQLSGPRRPPRKKSE